MSGNFFQKQLGRRVSEQCYVVVILSLLFITFIAKPILAAPLFQLNINDTDPVHPGSYSHTYDTAPDLVSDLENLSSHFTTSYTNNDPITAILSFRGIPITVNYAQSSPTLKLDIDSIGLHQTFSGTTRNDSVEQLKDWFTKSGSDTLKALMQDSAKTTPNDPMAGNPSSLSSQMVANSFNQGFMDKVSFLGSSSAGQQPVVTTGAANVNANLFGVEAYYSRFTNDNANIDSLTIPLFYTFRSNEDERKQFTITVPVTWNRYDSANSYATGLGLALSIPITDKNSEHQWILTPSVYYLLAASLDMYSGGQLLQGGVTSAYSYQMGDYRFGMGNSVAYQQSIPLAVADIYVDPGICNTIFTNSLVVSIRTTKLVSGTALEMFVTDTRFTGHDLYSNYSDEFGIAWGFVKRDSVERFKDSSKITRNILSNFRLGFSYTIAEGNKGVTVNLGSTF